MAAPLPLIILRPQPGAGETAARAVAAGLMPRIVPLFSAGPLDWALPGGGGWEAVLLTSANAPRFAGDGLVALAGLPLWCVGKATAQAARAAGLVPQRIGDGGAQALIETAAANGVRSMLWLAGEERTALSPPEGLNLSVVPVYHAAPLAVEPSALAGPAVALLHSKRAARRLANLAPEPGRLHLVAISPAVAEAARAGWASLTTVQHPDDGDMVAMAAKLCHGAQ